MFKSVRVVLGWVVRLAVTVSLIGGLAADIPGVKEDPGGNLLLGLASRALLSLLHIVWHYPLGATLAVAVLVFFHWVFTEPKNNALRSGFAKKRALAHSHPRRKNRKLPRKR